MRKGPWTGLALAIVACGEPGDESTGTEATDPSGTTDVATSMTTAPAESSGGDSGDSSGGGSATCGPTGSCLHYAGTVDGAPFDITCGEGLVAPSVNAGIFNSGCGQGSGVQPLDAGAFQLGGGLAVGTYTYGPDDTTGVADPSVNLQFSGPLGMFATDSGFVQSVAIEITEFTADTLVAGTFVASWSSTPAVDLVSIEWAHLCLGWNMDGCYMLGMMPPAGCECVMPPVGNAAELEGSFRFEIP